MIEFSITSGQIMWFCSFIAAVWGVIKIVKELRKPGEDLRKMVEHHDELLHGDNERLKEIETSNRMMLQSLLVLINHNISGNGVDKMKSMRDELQEFLINK